MFAAGDRIRYINSVPNGQVLTGDTGTVCCDQTRGSSIIHVKWDRYVGGHSCGGLCEHGHGWNVHKLEIEYFEDEDSECEIDEQEFADLLSAGTSEHRELNE